MGHKCTGRSDQDEDEIKCYLRPYFGHRTTSNVFITWLTEYLFRDPVKRRHCRNYKRRRHPINKTALRNDSFLLFARMVKNSWGLKNKCRQIGINLPNAPTTGSLSDMNSFRIPWWWLSAFKYLTPLRALLRTSRTFRYVWPCYGCAVNEALGTSVFARPADTRFEPFRGWLPRSAFAL